MHLPRILIVDDEPAICEVLCRLLRRRHLDAIPACSVQEALGLIKVTTFGRIFLDVSLPGIGGVDFCRALRASAETAHIPVLLMSGKLPDDVMTAVGERLGVPVLAKTWLFDDLPAALDLLNPNSGPRRYSRRVFIDRDRERIEIDGRPLPRLSHQHFRLLHILSERTGPVPREELLRLMKPDGENVSLVDVAVYRLRKRLSLVPSVRIESTGSGYRLIVQ